MKTYMLTIGFLGGAIASLFGGFNGALTTLVIFMIIDYISGVIIAAVFRNSKKTKSGALDSKVGWTGITKKAMTLIIVLMASQLGNIIGSTMIKDVVIIAYIANEAISIVENAGIMGVPIPDVIKNAIDVLKQKAERGNDVK